MKIYVATRERETLSLWRSKIEYLEGVEYSSSVPPELKSDAVVVSGIFAFDRYGGRPNRREAQILENFRSDGFPQYVVIPPFRPMVRLDDGSYDISPEYRDVTPSYHAISCTLRDILIWNSMAQGTDDEINTVVLDLPLLGMNNPLDSSTPESVAKAIREHLPHPD